MRALGLLAAWTATLYLATPALAWNATGHYIIAAIAYDRLTPKTRARVDELIKRHPDYATILTRNAPADPAARARAAFILASVWPDTIKGDNRFYDDTRADAKPTPSVAGFPDMAKHTNWHYYDIEYAPDGAHAEKQKPPNALTELKRLIKELGDPHQDPARLAYDLPWFEHIAGDVGQPLHCVSRYLKSQPEGDAGGNRVFVAPRGNLHSLWDGAAGNDTSDAYVTRYAAEVTAEYRAPAHIEKNPKKWIEEGFKVDKTDVYTFGLETGTREHPIPLPDGYVENSRRIARARVAIAGYRLAAILNDKLK
jgi:hypothetical protein